MPSIGDIANEAKALLEDIKDNTADIKDNTADIKNNTASTDNHVVQLIGVNQVGFTNLAQGMALQILIQKQANELLELNCKQNETIICWLKTIAAELCQIVRNTKIEVLLQTQIKNTLSHIDKIIELANSREAMEVLRRDELENKIENCCKDEEKPEPPCYEECAVPKHPAFHPITEKWEPIKFDKANNPK